jgi:hypothetical protein
MSETLCGKRRIVDLPNGGTWRNLRRVVSLPGTTLKDQRIPLIELIHNICALRIQDSDQVFDDAFEVAQFSFMHEVHD